MFFNDATWAFKLEMNTPDMFVIRNATNDVQATAFVAENNKWEVKSNEGNEHACIISNFPDALATAFRIAAEIEASDFKTELVQIGLLAETKVTEQFIALSFVDLLDDVVKTGSRFCDIQFVGDFVDNNPAVSRAFFNYVMDWKAAQ